MNVIELDAITDGVLLESSVPEDDFPPWDPDKSYAVGDCVMRSIAGVHQNFEALVAGADATSPEVSIRSDTPRWLKLGPTNRWAMFDDAIGTATTAETSIEVSLTASGAGALLLMELVGRAVRVERLLDGQRIYEADVSLDDTPISGFYDWFFLPFQQRSSVVLRDLPAAVYGGSLRVLITGTAGVACGVCRPGAVRSIGLAEYGVEFGIEDYSTKERDRYGRSTLVEGSYAHLVKVRAETKASEFNRLVRSLAGLRAKLAYYEITNQDTLINVNVLGYYKEFRLNIPGPIVHYCTLDLESLAMTL